MKRAHDGDESENKRVATETMQSILDNPKNFGFFGFMPRDILGLIAQIVQAQKEYDEFMEEYNSQPQEALFAAAERTNPIILAEIPHFVAAGGNVNHLRDRDPSHTNYQVSPLHTCIRMDNSAAFEALCKSGAQTTSVLTVYPVGHPHRPPTAYSALIHAIGHKSNKCITHILNDDTLKALELSRQHKWSPYVSAVKKKALEYIPQLKQAGFDINGLAQGKTALMHAAESGWLEGVRLLKEHGADVTLANNRGQTAADIARQHGHNDLADEL